MMTKIDLPHSRYRPMFWPWYMKLDVVFDADVLSREQIINMFEIAGSKVGIGEWRAQRYGPCGAFHVDNGFLEKAV